MNTQITRRGLAGLAVCVLGAVAAKKKPVILLRSGWQTVNIGDIAHTPGVLRVLSKVRPDAQVILWSNAVDRGVAEMLQRNFPALEIVTDRVEGPGAPLPPAVKSAFDRADFFLHGSGPSVVAANHVALWRQQTKKPYGIFGVTITAQSEAASTGITPELKALLDGAKFVYTRETKSLANVKNAGVKSEVGFSPDGAFSFDLRDETRAKAFLQQNGLEQGRFIAVIPRLRLTPYHKIRPVTWDAAEIRRREAINERYAEQDHAKMREGIIAYVRQTGGKALLCPEMTYQLDIIGPLLCDPLPADVKKNVVRRTEYWLPDEAASTYARAALVMSHECHSPILAAAQGTPCMYVHQPEDGIKGQMWNDVGLNEWYLQAAETRGAEVAKTVLGIVRNPDAARAKVKDAVTRAQALQQSRIRSMLA